MVKFTDAQRQDRRQQIVSAARTCFSRNGFHSTTTIDIVRAAGVAQGTFYLYFPTKDDLIVALADDRRDGEALINSMAEAEGGPVEGLKLMLELHTRSLGDPALRDERRVAVQGWAEALRNEVVHRQLTENSKAVIGEIAHLIELGRQNGQFKSDVNPEGVARMLVALFRGFTLQAVWDETYDPSIVEHTVSDMLRGALLTTPAADPTHTSVAR